MTMSVNESSLGFLVPRFAHPSGARCASAISRMRVRSPLAERLNVHNTSANDSGRKTMCEDSMPIETDKTRLKISTLIHTYTWNTEL